MRPWLAIAGAALAVAASGCRDGAKESPGPDASPPAGHRENGDVVFVRRSGNGWRLLRAGPEGRTIALSPRLFPGPEVALSPEGRRIAFTQPRAPGRPHDLFVVPVDGAKAVRVDATPVDERSPRWSHDGRWIAVTAVSREASHVFVADPRERRTREATSQPGQEYGTEWASDQPLLLYSHGPLFGPTALYVTDPRIGGVRRVTDGERYERGVWSPTGEILVAATESLAAQESRIELLDADGANRRLVATTQGDPYELAVSPSGERAAAAVTFGESSRVVVFRLRGDPFALTAEMGVEAERPVWSPDGARIAFVRRGDVWTMKADGTDERRVTETDAREDVVAWLSADAG